MSVPPSRQSAFADAPMQDLIDILLRQFRRPLANFGVELSAQEIEAIADDVAARHAPGEKAKQVKAGLVKVVQESENVLSGWGLTFQQSLQTEMGDMPGWETTAEFLEIANEKSNAELRIAAGSILLAALGDEQFMEYLHFLKANPRLDEVSAVAARRVLVFLKEGEESSENKP